MKKFYFMMVMLILGVVGTQAQGLDLYIQFNSGASTFYGLNTVDKITFSSTEMKVHLAGGNVTSYSIARIRYYNLKNNVLSNVNKTTLSTEKLKVYPNPASDVVYLDYVLKNNSKVELFIYNVSGQELFTRSKDEVAGSQQQALSLNEIGLETGVYFVELRTSNERFINKLILN